MKDYNKRLESLRGRRKTDDLVKAFDISESFDKKEYGESITYILEAMQPISEQYTINTFAACRRLQQHLFPGLYQRGINVGFDYQGSVVTNTHIKTYSDVDMLMIHGLFYHLQPPQVPPNPYNGDTIADLSDLREHARVILDTVFSACSIDDTGNKALKISGGTLRREIDIIPGAWYHSVKYSETANKFFLGVNILDRGKGKQILNYPFAHAENINVKDTRVFGNLKRLIRLLKTLRADAIEPIKLSSYDIASLAFRIEDNMLIVPRGKELQLIVNCKSFFDKVISNEVFRNELHVANGTRKIFCDDGAKLEELIKLNGEVGDILSDIAQDVRPLLQQELIYG